MINGIDADPISRHTCTEAVYRDSFLPSTELDTQGTLTYSTKTCRSASCRVSLHGLLIYSRALYVLLSHQHSAGVPFELESHNASFRSPRDHRTTLCGRSFPFWADTQRPRNQQNCRQIQFVTAAVCINRQEQLLKTVRSSGWPHSKDKA
jgi:hypothetical protein